jgi:predicted nuclease of predicted toxin-antitoxin system
VKFLFDQNISFRVFKLLRDTFTEVNQISVLRLENKSDFKIWKYAKKNNFTIVSFESDFSDLANFYGHPLKIICVRTGNITTKYIANSFTENESQIKAFVEVKDFKDLATLEIK